MNKTIKETGSFLLTNEAVRLSMAWRLFLINLLRPFYESSFNAPLFIQKQTLIDSEYLNHFPQHVFLSASYKYPNSGNKKFLTPAACLHIYPLLQNSKISQKNFSALIFAQCARFESGKWSSPFRTADFHMLELVIIGEKKDIEDTLKKISKSLVSMFRKLDFNGQFVPSTDAFFMGNDEGAKVIQKLKELKKEFVVKINNNPTALASINNHEEYFGRHFNIKKGKNFAWSVCIAFGIERLTHYGLIKWGKNQKNWPNAIRKYAEIS